MQNDRLLRITTGQSRKAAVWKPETLLWSALITRLQTPHRSTETMQQYLAMPKSQQDELKDVGGFVAGTISGNRRRANAVTGRDIVTLDLDSVPPNGTDEVLRRLSGLSVAYCVYSTRKHRPEASRLRVLIPLDRICTADEYEPIARKIAELIGMQYCDPTTFEASRLMYYPSCCADGQYVFCYEDKPFASADGILGMYQDWRNITEWAGLSAPKISRGAKQSDPTEKNGVVGAFCRIYDIPAAIAAFLPDKYTDCGQGRYTYTGGSTTGGAVLYENGKFLFSHHATDPASGKLCNAFDLVRLHLFADKDDDAKPDTPANKLPSYNEMCRFAASDERVSTLMNQERYKTATEAFSTGAAVQTAAQTDTEWMRSLKIHPETGMPLKTTENILLILENDPNLKDAVVFDDFSNRLFVVGKLPWSAADAQPGSGRRDWKDSDDAGLRFYLEKVYGITGVTKILDGFALCCEKHKVNFVQQYLNALPPWDNIPRLDTLFIDYLGAEDSAYTRAAARKSLCAAVARAMKPGAKYDTMPILAGPQGIGKSTLLRYLGGEWFNDSLTTFAGKDASEMLQGSWIVEVGELVGMSKMEENQVKQFLSRVEDIFREAYGRRVGRYPRRCVFFGTSNEYEFLRDRTGGRRFWPVDCAKQPPKKSVFRDLPHEVPQIWAEALAMWRIGEPLYLENTVTAGLAKQAQDSHAVSSPKEGIVREFLERMVPEDWNRRSLDTRRLFWAGGLQADVKLVPRDRVCAVEIWCEALGGEAKYFKRQDAQEINAIIERTEGWERAAKGLRFGTSYGVQRGSCRREKS
ncbi:MAG: virulence-associated protein E [Oscillospiraceae bacterium]|nr:virulence-associated protein E [Oscillospiraceae bacterium]